MRNIKMVIKYDGTKYTGWQRLKENDNTIQGKIESVLSKMTGEKIEIIGSGRTDAGVHALQQIANFKTNSKFNLGEIKNYLYDYLPEDILVYSLEEVDDKFHARYNAKSKKYVYKILNNKYRDPFSRKYVLHVPQSLDIQAMKTAIEHLIGEHDFTSFCTKSSKKKPNVRTIYSIDIIKDNSNLDFIFHGDGFLYNMIRIIVGTLIEIGTGQMKAEKIKSILEAKKREVAGQTVPPTGLYLMEVQY